jgi:hypothetical protein
LTSLPQVGNGAAARIEDQGGEGSGEATPYSPPDVNPLIHPKLPGEGVWQKAGAKVGPEPPVLLTTFRWPGTFNGGFPLETSNAGLIYRGKVREAMVDGIATVVGYRGGGFDIVKWESGEKVPKNVWFAKQNLPLPEMYRSPERYLVPDERDFFAVYLKPKRPW